MLLYLIFIPVATNLVILVNRKQRAPLTNDGNGGALPGDKNVILAILANTDAEIGWLKLPEYNYI